VAEIYNVATNAGARYFSTVPLIVAGIFYLVMNTVVEMAFKLIEKKLDYYRT